MHFQFAITRLPADTFSQGISTSNLGKPDIALALAQHHQYVAALQKAGLDCVVLPPDPAFPDSVFVEDTAIVSGNWAMITRPGAMSRRDEIEDMSQVLATRFKQVLSIRAPGTLDGGDICMAGNHFFIGISNRTNPAGAQLLADVLVRHGFSSEFVDIRPMAGILHLKSSVNYLGDNTMLLDPRMADLPAFQAYRRLVVPDNEIYAANCLRVNNYVLVPAGFPGVLKLVQEAGFQTLEVDVSEYEKMDGGLSCLSLRW